MDTRIVIVAYKAKPGKEEILQDLMRKHYNALKELDLVSERKPVLMNAKDNTIIEVFEWKDKDAIKAAHNHPEVLKMWAEYNEACEYVPLNTLAESKDMFAEFSSFE